MPRRAIFPIIGLGQADLLVIGFRRAVAVVNERIGGFGLAAGKKTEGLLLGDENAEHLVAQFIMNLNHSGESVADRNGKQAIAGGKIQQFFATSLKELFSA